MRLRYLFPVLLWWGACITSPLFGQNCLESTTSLTVTSTVVLNAYHPGAGNALAGSTTIRLGAERAGGANGTIQAGDLVLVIQMQGAEIVPTLPDNTGNYGDGPGGQDRAGFVTNPNYIAGQYEYAVAQNTLGAAGGTLQLQAALTNSYLQETTPTSTIGRRTFQVVKVASFYDLTLQTGGKITTYPWNGTTGGVIALDVNHTFTLNGTLDADYAGFRGGFRQLNERTANDTGYRGEGIAGTPRQVYGFNDTFTALVGTTGLPQGYPGTTSGIYDPDKGYGAPGNAGGSSAEDGGGGGGGNGGRGGGGGASPNFNSSTISAGGTALRLDAGARLFLGGGGGSGGIDDETTNRLEVSSGRPGGGIIVIRANALQGAGTGLIRARGNHGDDGSSAGANTEGSGGGGAGGTIVLLTSTDNLSPFTIAATGGNGTTSESITGGNDAGGGGGGGGNVLLIRRGGTFASTGTVQVTEGAGGQNGTGSYASGGVGGLQILTSPPASNLDCALINLPDAAPGGIPAASLIIWLRADQAVTYNGSQQVSRWTGQSGGAYPFTTTALTTLGTTPDYIAAATNTAFNFNPSIAFRNPSDYLGVPEINNFPTANLSYFAVTQTADNVNRQTVASYLAPSATSGDDHDFHLELTANQVQQTFKLGRQLIHPTEVRDGRTRILAGAYRNDGGAAGVDSELRLDYQAPTTANLNAGNLRQSGALVLGQDLDNLTSGGFSATERFRGEMAEFILVDITLTTVQQQKVSTYLAIKYGVSLPGANYLNSAGDVIFPGSTETTYNRNVAGIGRDDASRLLQRKSRSIQNDARLTVETSAFAMDRQFSVWGHNGGALAFSTADLPAGVTQRLARAWKMYEINTPGALALSFDVSGLTLPTGNLVLLVDDNGTFASGTQRLIPATTYAGGVVTFENVDLASGEVFTVGIAPSTPGGAATAMGLWLKANAGTSTTTSGATVASWSDQSGRTNHATNATAAARPTYVPNAINGNPALDFDGTNDYIGGTAGAYSRSYYIVLSPDAAISRTLAGQMPFGMGSSANTYNYGGLGLGSITGSFTNEVILHLDGSSTNWRRGLTGNATYAAATPYLIAVRDNAAANSLNLSLNGVNVDNSQVNSFSTIVNTAYNVGNTNPGSSGAAAFFNGKVAEVITFTNRTADAEHARIQSYLAIKYGLTLDQTTRQDYVASNGTVLFPATQVLPDFSLYANDIAAIGRDDLSALDQRASRSVNSDAIVTVTHPTSFTHNFSFLAWGNDNAALTEDPNPTDAPANVTRRLRREWRVAKTGTVGPVTLSFNLSGLTVTGTRAQDFLLMLDANGDFSDGFVQTLEATSWAGNVVTFEGVDLVDGTVFTLATAKAPSKPGGVATALWLRADAGVSCATGGCPVASWQDQSGNGYTATGTAPYQPTVASQAMNGHQALHFDGISQRLTTNFTQNPATAAFSVFTVSQPEVEDRLHMLLSQKNGGGGTGRNLLGYDNAPAGTLYTNLGGTATNSSATYTTTAPGIYGYTYDLATTSQQWYLNGQPDLAATYAASSSTGAWVIGANKGESANFLQGALSEVMVFPKRISSQELQRVHSYLATKYGITLQQGTMDYTSSTGTLTYPVDSDPGYRAYRHDIALIGRDDATALHQQWSQSVNTGSAVSMLKNEPFTADQQFIGWGDNGQDLKKGQVADVPSGIESRLTRVWKVSTTNQPSGTLDLTFDLTDVNVGEASNLRLLVDQDGTFEDATVVSPTISQAGNRYTFHQVKVADLPNGSYFTLASSSLQDTPLPVRLLTFDGHYEASAVRLRWATATETENAYFEVLRSDNGSDFRPIGRRDGQGTTAEPYTYTFADYDVTGGTYVYRLRQVDFDGAVTYSPLLSVQVTAPPLQAQVFPNPSDGEAIQVVIHHRGKGEAVQVWVVSPLGATEWRKEVMPVGPPATITDQLPRLSPGLHYLHLRQGDATVVHKLIVQ
ncbi:hypothetical protein SAMN05421823_11435 [Catalinimonas alkaloidigena]|uniref:DUF8202 domain-containing protein n=1 Tax=Catalinimonas alkaloidigena TaxID=1075417 RepID=A0A1G9TIV5_9BACT|nr:T9SS type A sorting domain-containing protein [Catalinimonas alkaloidigena]SDM47709.1 hypothetical protein SAMN05421823_11435 [Catalinimonas alkaloidigena]